MPPKSAGTLPNWLRSRRHQRAKTVPSVSRVVVIFNPATAPFAEYHLKSLNNAATSFGVEARVAHVSDVSELETVVATQAREPNSGLIVLNEDFMIAHD
jgi:putative tryptophan/tyrosine transport system substrate-binding protein